MSLFSFIHIKNSQWHVTYYIMSLPQLKVPSILPHGHRSHFKHIICQPRFGPSNIRMNWMIDGFYCVLHVGCECGLATRSYVCVLWSFICVKIKEKKKRKYNEAFGIWQKRWRLGDSAGRDVSFSHIRCHQYIIFVHYKQHTQCNVITIWSITMDK